MKKNVYFRNSDNPLDGKGAEKLVFEVMRNVEKSIDIFRVAAPCLIVRLQKNSLRLQNENILTLTFLQSEANSRLSKTIEHAGTVFGGRDVSAALAECADVLLSKSRTQALNDFDVVGAIPSLVNGLREKNEELVFKLTPGAGGLAQAADARAASKTDSSSAEPNGAGPEIGRLMEEAAAQKNELRSLRAAVDWMKEHYMSSELRQAGITERNNHGVEGNMGSGSNGRCTSGSLCMVVAAVLAPLLLVALVAVTSALITTKDREDSEIRVADDPVRPEARLDKLCKSAYGDKPGRREVFEVPASECARLEVRGFVRACEKYPDSGSCGKRALNQIIVDLFEYDFQKNNFDSAEEDLRLLEWDGAPEDMVAGLRKDLDSAINNLAEEEKRKSEQGETSPQ